MTFKSDDPTHDLAQFHHEPTFDNHQSRLQI
jgi:hypothetical protein